MAHLDSSPSNADAGLRILVVDDDRDAADSLAILVGLWGHRPRAVYGAEGALVVAADEPPDVVLLDVGLPGMDGFKLAAGLRALAGMDDAVFFAVTGHTHLAYRDRAKACRFTDVLLKPVEPDFLRKLLEEQQAVRPRPPAVVLASKGK